MAYVALRPRSFGGQNFRVGDVIPEELIAPGMAKNMIQMNLIARQGEDGLKAVSAPAKAAEVVRVMVHAEEGETEFLVTPEGIQSVFDVLTGEATEAEDVIEQMTDNEALILLHMSDRRKTVKAAAEARGKALAQGEGEQ